MKPKLLFILHLPPPIHGAAIVSELIKQSKLINFEFNCRYINLSTSRSLTQIGDLSYIKCIRYLGIIFFELWQLIFFRPDVVYISLNAKGVGFYKDSLIALIAKCFSKKVVYHFHNKGVSERHNIYLDNIIYRMVFKSSFVILLSEKLYSDICKYKSIEKIYYCFNGIPDSNNRKNIFDSNALNSIPTILFLSNLIEAKGVYVLLDACAILRNKNIQFKCNYVGEIGDVNEFSFKNRVNSLKLDNWISYLGPKYGIEKSLEYHKADIFVFPTFYNNETFGLVNLEAMQNSLPVISTNVGAISDVIDDYETGFLINPNDAFELAEKLEILILDPLLRKKMGNKGRKKYEKSFTIDRFEENLSNILNQISK